MEKKLWNEDWTFWIGGDPFALIKSKPEEAKIVTLPHDRMIETAVNKYSTNGKNTGYHDGEIYHYTKNLFVDENEIDKTFFLYFEGFI